MVEQAELKPPIQEFQPMPKITIGAIVAWCQENNLLAKLTDRQKTVITLHWLKQLPYREIAPIIGANSRQRVEQIERKAWKKILIQIPETPRTIVLKLLESNKRKELWQNPKYGQNISEGLRKSWQDPELEIKRRVRRKKRRLSQKISQILQKRWQDQNYRQQMDRLMKSLEYRSKQGQQTQENWQDPKFRRKISRKMRRKWKDPVYSKKMGSERKSKWEEQGFRENISRTITEKWQEPDFRKNVLSGQKRALRRRLMSAERQIKTVLIQEALINYGSDVLTELEINIIINRYPLFPKVPRTLSELSEKFGMSKSGVHKTEQRALRKLQQSQTASSIS